MNIPVPRTILTAGGRLGAWGSLKEVVVFGSVSQRRALTYLIVISSLTLACHATVSLAAAWTGSTKTIDGVEHVVNPDTPMAGPVTLTLRELWRVGGDSESDEEFFGVIDQVVADRGGNVYLLDSQLSQVKVFSPEGLYLRTIGREGEGPGEFRSALDMFFLPDGRLAVLQVAPGRIVAFTLEGELAGDHPTPRSEGGGRPALLSGHAMGENLVLVISENEQREGAIDIHRSLILADSEGVELKRLLTSTRTLSFVNFLFDETVWRTFDNRWKVAPSGDLYVADKYLDYEIIVWDPQGNRKRVIVKEYDHWSRSEDQKKEMHDIFDALLQNQLPEYTIKVSDCDPDVSDVFPRDDGTLWVLTSRGANDRPDGSMGVFDVFDAAGRFVRQVTLMGEGEPLQDGYFFVGDRLLVVTDLLEARIASSGGRTSDDEGDEEPEPVAVICYELDSKMAIAQVDANR